MNDGLITLDFPSIPSSPMAPKDVPARVKGLHPIETLSSKQDLMVVLPSEDLVREFKVDPSLVCGLAFRGLIVTAQGTKSDFVSRCFYPELQVDEDPVTGSAHCQLAPYWGRKLGKEKLVGRQLSQRGGTVYCEVKQDRVFLSGKTVKYLQGTIVI